MYILKETKNGAEIFILFDVYQPDDKQAWEVTAEQYKLKWRYQTEELNLLKAPRKPSWQFKVFQKLQWVRGCQRCTTHRKPRTEVFIEQHIKTVIEVESTNEHLEKEQITAYEHNNIRAHNKSVAIGDRISWGLDRWSWACGPEALQRHQWGGSNRREIWWL